MISRDIGTRTSHRVAQLQACFREARTSDRPPFSRLRIYKRDIEEAHLAASQVAERIPVWVVSVGYSLAPEFPFPTAPKDAYIASTWAARNARHYRADADRIGVAGHDPGGNIAAGLAAIAHDESLRPIRRF